MNASLGAAAESMHGRLIGTDGPFVGVSTDTRSLATGNLFFALTGPNFDGHRFVAEADRRGAAGAVVSAPDGDARLAQIAVDDTRLALGRLAAAWRSDCSPVVVGITGSNGKTTLKELTAACLAQSGPTLATEGNLNNDIGMPLMLLRIGENHHFAVIEMGANHLGEIAYLTSLARPDVAVISNAGAAHLEGFGSLDGVATGKGEILQGESRPGCAVLNADDSYYGFWRELAGDIDVLSFGLSDQADVRADDIAIRDGVTHFRLHVAGTAIPARLALAGEHNVRNACAAAAVATALGIAPADIAAGLATVRPVSGRLEAIEGHAGATVYDDSYNANPLSVTAAGEFLATQPGERWFVLGDMAELGDDAARLHREVGAALRHAGIERLFATGELSREACEGFGEGARWYADVAALADDVLNGIDAGTCVLVKGSRSMRMERVVEALRAPARRRAGG